MNQFDINDLKKLYMPSPSSHKGQNGKLAIIGGSHLFHGASLWALKVASRIVDMVFYSSVLENNELTQKLKGDLYDFIAVPRESVEEYIAQSDSVLIGPGLAREDGRGEDEEPTRELTQRLLEKFPDRKWVIDAGSLQTMNAAWLKELNGNVIITPHQQEFIQLFDSGTVEEKAKEYNSIILLKGEQDVVCSQSECVEIAGGNAGMTKGGTGDVLAGLVAAVSCKNA